MTPAPEGRRLRLGRFETLQALAGGVTHEINNLLASVVLSVDLLEPRCHDDGDREVLASLAQLARRLQHAGRQLDWLARGVDGGAILFQPQYLLADVQKLAAVAFPDTVALVTRYPADLQPLAGEPLRVHQLLLTLACEAWHQLRPPGGTVILAARNAPAPGAAAGAAAGVLFEVSIDPTAIPAARRAGGHPAARAAAPASALSASGGAAAKAPATARSAARRWAAAVARTAGAAGARLDSLAEPAGPAGSYRGRSAWLPAAPPAAGAEDQPSRPA
jgi:hypothetical protein